MKIILTLFPYLVFGWLGYQGIKSVYVAWYQSPENPTRLFLADFSGMLILVGLTTVFMPYGYYRVLDVSGGMLIVTARSGIGQIEREELVGIKTDTFNQHLIRRFIAYPRDVVSIEKGHVYINSQALKSTNKELLSSNISCEEFIVPDRYFVGMKLELNTISCGTLYTYKIENLVQHCISVVWPWAATCSREARTTD